MGRSLKLNSNARVLSINCSSSTKAFAVPSVYNEPVLSFAPDSAERGNLKKVRVQ